MVIQLYRRGGVCYRGPLCNFQTKVLLIHVHDSVYTPVQYIPHTVCHTPCFTQWHISTPTCTPVMQQDKHACTSDVMYTDWFSHNYVLHVLICAHTCHMGRHTRCCAMRCKHWHMVYISLLCVKKSSSLVVAVRSVMSCMCHTWYCAHKDTDKQHTDWNPPHKSTQ